MSYQNNTSQRASGLKNRASGRILTIDWKLLFQRLRLRLTTLFRSARNRAEHTEYTPPVWAQSFRLGWFRLGLMAIALFVFTQKQVDFTISVGKMGIAATDNRLGALNTKAATTSKERTASSNSSTMSVMPTLASNPTTVVWSVMDYDEASVKAYINRFTRVAQTEEEKFNIPAAAKLAIAIYESDAGNSPNARENNNHFGRITANGFYPNAWANWRAHSELIANEYPDLKAYAGSVENWINTLATTNYTKDPDYDRKLMAIIERFGLQ